MLLPDLHTGFREAGQVVWYYHLFKNFPHFVVIHTVKVCGVVNKAEVDVFLALSCSFYGPMDVSNENQSQKTNQTDHIDYSFV